VSKNAQNRLFFFDFHLLNLVFVIVLIASIFSFCFFLMNPTLIAGSDFVSYRTGAEILLGEDRKNLYDISTQAKYQKEELDLLGRKVLPFRNPSPIALLFMPFAFLPEIWAYRLFAIANLAILVFAVQLFGKSIFRKPNQYIYWVALTFWPVISTIITGQISILLLVLFAYMYIFLETNKPFQLGIVSSLLLLKPQYVIFLPFLFLLTNLKGKYLKGLFLGGLMLLLLTVLISGVEFLWRYPKFLMATESPTYGSHIKSYVGFSSFLQNIGTNFNLPSYLPFILNAMAYFFMLFIFARYVRKKNLGLLYSSAIIFTLIFSIHTWIHDLVLLLIPMFVILQKMTEKSVKGKKILFALFLILFLLFLILDSNLKDTAPFILFAVGVIFLRLNVAKVVESR